MVNLYGWKALPWLVYIALLLPPFGGDNFVWVDLILVIMKIATYNVNGINGRLPVLLRWLSEASPDIVCLQELKAPQEKFPEKAIQDAGYNAI